MALKINTIRCPGCGADIPVDENRTTMYCSYCGTKVVITNENEKIIRHIDEAGLKRAETDRIERLSKLKLLESSRSSVKYITIIWIAFIGFLLLTSVFMLIFDRTNMVGILLIEITALVAMFTGEFVFKKMPARENDRLILESGGIRFPEGLEPFTDQHYETVEMTLKRAGFRNIVCINRHDITFGVFSKPGKVASVSVNGEEIAEGGRVYLPDAPITISYHGK